LERVRPQKSPAERSAGQEEMAAPGEMAEGKEERNARCVTEAALVDARACMEQEVRRRAMTFRDALEFATGKIDQSVAAADQPMPD
jgi:hypothetical protein